MYRQLYCEACNTHQNVKKWQVETGHMRTKCPTCKTPRMVVASVTQLREKILKRMGFKSYRDYLASDFWREIRERVLKRDGRRCVACQRETRIVHHRKYDAATLKGETLEWLSAICRDCHDAIEFAPTGQKNTVSRANRRLAALMQTAT